MLAGFEPTFALEINKIKFSPPGDLPGAVELICLLQAKKSFFWIVDGGAFRTNSELNNPLKTDAVTTSKILLGLKQTLNMTISALRNSTPLPFALVM